MKIHALNLALAMAAVLSQSLSHAQVVAVPPAAPLLAKPSSAPVPRAVRPQASRFVAPTAPSAEAAATARGAASSLNGAGVFNTPPAASAQSVTPLATALSPPVTVNYGGSSPVFTINNSGTDKGLQVIMTNPKNVSSAVYGQTLGAGGGVTGYNGGTIGFAGKFGNTNPATTQPAIMASTTGTGPVLLAETLNPSSTAPVVFGESDSGIGVEGTSTSYAGLYGSSNTGDGVLADANDGYGVYATSNTSSAVYAESNTGAGMSAYSNDGQAIYAESENADGIDAVTYLGVAALSADNKGGGRGIVSHSANDIGVYSSSDSSIGIWGQSKNSYGVVGEDSGSGYGVWGQSATGYAGYFNGKVAATSYLTISDRNAKMNFAAVNGKELLDRVNRLPITTWDYKTDAKTRHLGPMAQDFHQQFGLNGDDDTHINLSDIAGVSLAAIQELSRQVKQKDAQIAALTARLEALSSSVEARLTALEKPRIEHAQKAASKRSPAASPAAL